MAATLSPLRGPWLIVHVACAAPQMNGVVKPHTPSSKNTPSSKKSPASRALGTWYDGELTELSLSPILTPSLRHLPRMICS